MARTLPARIRKLQEGLWDPDQIYLIVIAVIIGLGGGLSAVGFRFLIQTVQRWSWGRGSPPLDYIHGLPAWWPVLVPTVGGLVVGLIVHTFAREAKGHGVPEVMEAVALRGGRIRPRVVAAKMLASGVCIGTGGSVGREGPIVQIGSALGSTIGQWFRLDRQRMRTLVGCGAAAGIAATFNAPVAGALFAVEVILGDFGVAQFSPIVISSVAGTVVSQYFLGDFPAFRVPTYQLKHPLELLAYAGLGVLAGLVAVAFIRILYFTEDLWDNPRFRLYPPLKTMLGGLAIGVIGLFLPQVFGVGYEAIDVALHGSMAFQLMLLLVVAKIVAVSTTIGSGGSGGIFAPSLFIGAMLGGAVGTVLHALWPESTAAPGAYALVGMGALVGATTHAPITAILIIFELTATYKIMLPLMITCIIATLLSTRIQHDSIYTLKLVRRGIDIFKGRAVNVLSPVSVSEVMRRDMATVSPDARLGELMNQFMDHSGSTLFVTDRAGGLVGMLTTETLRPLLKDAPALESLIIAADIMTAGEMPKVSVSDSLADVMKQLGTHRGEIPVLDGTRLAGVVWPQDVIARYNTEVFKRDMARSVASAVDQDDTEVNLVRDTVVAEVTVPSGFVSRTLRDLDIRGKFGVSVLMVKHRTPGGTKVSEAPSPDYTFRDGDVMLVMGPGNRVHQLKRAS